MGHHINNQLLEPEHTAKNCGVAHLLGAPEAQYTTRQMGYDLRPLVRKRLLHRERVILISAEADTYHRSQICRRLLGPVNVAGAETVTSP